MNLELKHLSPYLPYKLKIIKTTTQSNSEIIEMKQLDILNKAIYINNIFVFNKNHQPILKPLSEIQPYFKNLYGSLDHQDVTDYLDEDFLNSMDALDISEIGYKKIEYLPYGTLKVLLKHHFDVFDLIEAGLAIDYNTLKPFNKKTSSTTGKS